MPTELILLAIFVILVLISWIWSLVVAFRQNVALGILTIFFHPIPIIIIAFLNWRDAKYPMLLSVGANIGMFYFLFTFNSSGAGAMMDIIEHEASGANTEIEAAREAAEAMTAQLERMHRDGLISDEDYARQRAEIEQSTAVPDEAAVDPGSQPGAAPETEVTVEDPDAPAEPQPPVEEDVAAAEPEPKPVRPPVLSEQRRRALTPRAPVIRTIGFDNARPYIGKRVWILDKRGIEREGILTRVGRDHLVLERRLNKGTMSFVVYNDQIKRIRVEVKPGEG